MEINKIYKGDSIEVLKTFPSESVDFIFADPPYFGSFQDYDNFTKQWLGECKRVLKKMEQ